MTVPANVMQQIKKLLNENVNKYFATAKPSEKTPDKVKFFAQKQLDFFISGLARESRELQMKWAKGHPYHAHLRIKPNSTEYEVEINEDDGRR